MLLKDILENQTIELETSFKHHLMHDIIKGMLFLHGSELKYHGNLTSSNCVVDSRFTLKLADFGLARGIKDVSTPLTEYVSTRWYRAPELVLQ